MQATFERVKIVEADAEKFRLVCSQKKTLHYNSVKFTQLLKGKRWKNSQAAKQRGKHVHKW